MARIITCPGCSQQLAMEGVTAAQVRCPSCLRVLTLKKRQPAPVATEPAERPVNGFAPVAARPAAPAPTRFRLLPPALSLLPAGLLALLLLTFLIRDGLVRGNVSILDDEDEDEPVVELPIDPDPVLAIRMARAETLSFGLNLCKEKDDKGEPKRLTFDPMGHTDSVVVQIDDVIRLFGKYKLASGGSGRKGEGGDKVLNLEPAFFRGQCLQLPLDLGADRSGRQRIGNRAIYAYDSHHVEMTQTVEVVPGRAGTGQTHRHLDTCLVRYRIENKDSRPHRVAFRFVLDTFIGGNDGVPFLLPNDSKLCRDCKEFGTAQEVPDFIQALEKPDLDKPGTIAHLTLRMGREVEAPSRVTLGRWVDQMRWRADQEPTVEWNFPVQPMEGDSCVVLYWHGRELPPGEQRELGFAYGIGHVSSAEGGKLGVTTGGAQQAGDTFTVTSYVRDPVPGQTVTLKLSRHLQLVDGEATRTVPPLPAGSSSGISQVSWKVKAPRAGTFKVGVQSNNGMKHFEKMTITNPNNDKGSGIFG